MAEASHHSRFYQCIKKTGYLVKSPTSGKMGRWRKRWIMLVDSIVPCPNAGYERYARMEYYDVPENSRWCRDKTTKLSALKLKGVIDLRFCIAVQPSKNEKSKKFLFDIVTGYRSSSVHHFAAESQCERDEWIIALNEFLFTKNAIASGFQGSRPPLSRLHSSSSSHSNVSLDSNHNLHPHVHAMDDDVFIRGNEQSIKRTSKESLRRFLSANDISIKANEQVLQHIENPAQDIPSLQQQLALRYVPEIPPYNLRNLEVIGSGNFSLVSKGEWSTPSGPCVVAIKHASGNNATLRMLQEAVVLVQLWHPNVVNMLGLLEPQRSTTIVTEMCTQGNLIYLLKAMRSRIVTPVDLPSVLLKFGEQIILGLNYLTEKGFVHRYLTAKHILVTDQNVCKISGFACSSLLSNEREFILERDGSIPVKWTAPEATMYWRFTPASMVWSFGIILYEIWSLGQEPYGQLSNSQVIEWLLEGHRLPPPSGCFRSIYELMIACWHPDSERRPEPSIILRYLLQLESPTLHSLQAAHGVPTAATELGADVSAGEYLHPDLQEIYLRYANSGAHNDTGPEGGSKKNSCVSKQVNFNRRWSFSDDEEDSSEEDDDYCLADPLESSDEHTYVNDRSVMSDIEATRIKGEHKRSSKLVDSRRALATNLEDRWSLSTRGSEVTFNLGEPNDLVEDVLPKRQRHERRNRQPMSLPVRKHQAAAASYGNAQTPTTPRTIENESPSGMSRHNTAAVTPLGGGRWSQFDEDSDVERMQSTNSTEDETNCFRGPLKFGRPSNSSCSLDLSPSETKQDVCRPKVPRQKPPIKPRKKLPNATNGRLQTLHSPQNETIMTSQSAPSLLTPKAAPRNQTFTRIASSDNYDHLEKYKSIETIDEECLDRVLWMRSSRDDETVPIHYYNLPSTFSCSTGVHSADHNSQSYEQVQRYEKIQTYETIPYHFTLTTKVPRLKRGDVL